MVTKVLVGLRVGEEENARSSNWCCRIGEQIF